MASFCFGFTQRTWGEGWRQDIIIFLFLALSREWGSAVKLKFILMLKSKLMNWPNKSRICKKSGKLINYPSTTNSMILILLFVMNNILNNIISGLLCLKQTCHYHMFIILSYHSQLPHCYIFFLVEEFAWSKDTFPDLVFRVLLFQILLFWPIKRFCRLVFRN